MPRKLTDGQADDLVARYLAGEGTKQLGSAFGVSGRVVSDYLRRAGVQARPRHHGLVTHNAGLSHEERSVRTSESMRKRWAAASDEDRRRMLDPAHAACRGVPRPESVLVKSAITREAKAEPQSEYEALLARWLVERGAKPRHQAAIGRYNVDLAVDDIAIELTTGWARKHKWNTRMAYIIDQGWHLYFVWHDTRVPLLPDVADDLVAWAELLQSAPPADRQYRVVWRSTQLVAGGRADADEIADVLRSSRPRRDRA